MIVSVPLVKMPGGPQTRRKTRTSTRAVVREDALGKERTGGHGKRGKGPAKNKTTQPTSRPITLMESGSYNDTPQVVDESIVGDDPDTILMRIRAIEIGAKDQLSLANKMREQLQEKRQVTGGVSNSNEHAGPSGAGPSATVSWATPPPSSSVPLARDGHTAQESQPGTTGLLMATGWPSLGAAREGMDVDSPTSRERSEPMALAPIPSNNGGVNADSNFPRSTKLIPPFSGTHEEFRIWVSRMDVIARVNGWTEEQRRCIVLAALRGPAADYIFRTVDKRILADYRLLIAELDNRFTAYDVQATYQMQWRNIKQQPGESEQELVARIKSTYERAFLGRDGNTRRVDLLLKFYEALTDGGQRMAVEYNKNPQSIDEAARLATTYREAQLSYAESEYQYPAYLRAQAVSVEGDVQVRTMDPGSRTQEYPRGEYPRGRQRHRNAPDHRNRGKPYDRGHHRSQGLSRRELPPQLEQLQQVANITQPQSQEEGNRGNRKRNKGVCYRCQGTDHYVRDCPYPPGPNPHRPDIECHRCHQLGHIARNCPNPPVYAQLPGQSTTGTYLGNTGKLPGNSTPQGMVGPRAPLPPLSTTTEGKVPALLGMNSTPTSKGTGSF